MKSSTYHLKMSTKPATLLLKKWLEEHPIDLAPAESETETEAETETAAETEAETVTPGKHSLDWSKYIPEFFRNRWMSFVRR